MVNINTLINPAASVGGARATGSIDTSSGTPETGNEEFSLGVDSFGPVNEAASNNEEFSLGVDSFGSADELLHQEAGQKYRPDPEQASADKLYWDTTKQNFWLNAMDFVLPDEVMSIISTGAADPRAVSSAMNKSHLFYSITNPELDEQNKTLLAEEVLGETRLPISGLPTKYDRATSGALSGLGDPSAYIGAKTAIGAVGQGVQSLLPTFMGSVAAEQAVESAQSTGLSEEATQALALGSAFVAGTTTGVTQVPVMLGGKVVAGSAKTLTNRIVNKDKVISDALTFSQQKLTSDMLEAQADLPKIIAQAQRMAARLGQPDLQIAYIAPLVANPEINRRFNELYTKNSNGLKTQVDSAIKQYNNVLDNYLKQFGGNPTASERKARKAATTEQERILLKQQGVEQELDKKLIDIDNQIEELSQKLYIDSDSTEVGNQLKNLVKAQEVLARRKQSKAYETILTAAEQKNLTFESSSVERIYSLHKEQRFKELFGRGNRLSNIIDKELKPVKKPTGEFYPPTSEVEIKNPRPVIEETYPELTVRQIDSFKREINSMLRDKNLNESSRLTLNELKRTFEEELSRSQPEFSQALKAADLEYLEQVGVPFSMAGVSQVSRAKYASDATKKLLNPEAAAQFLAVTGEQGTDVLKSAILISLQDKAFKDGILNQNKLRTWMSKPENKRLLDMVPELSKITEDLPSLLDDATAQRQGIELQKVALWKDQTDDFFTSLGKSTDQVVNEMLNNNSKLNSHIDSINALSPNARGPILATIQQRMIGNALYDSSSKGKTFLETVTDPKNRTAYIKVLGPSYFKDLKALASIKDSQASLNLSKLQTGKTKQQSEIGTETVGLGWSRLSSIYRDRITSNFTKTMYLMSVVGSKQFGNAKDLNDVQFMLSPNTVNVLANNLERQADGNYSIKKGAEEAVASVLELVAKGGYSGGRTTTEALTYGERDEQEKN